MTTHIHESESGVSLRVTYSLIAGDLEFRDIRVLDGNYAPVGPDLCDFLHGLVVLQGAPSKDENGEIYPAGERYLSLLVREILGEKA